MEAGIRDFTVLEEDVTLLAAAEYEMAATDHAVAGDGGGASWTQQI